MYSVVLMMAMTSPADDLAFGRRNGCDGGAAHSCVGAHVSHSCHGGGFLGLRNRSHGCTGGYACHGGNGCTGGYACHGGNSCHGGGFLGLRDKLAARRAGCHGATAHHCCAPACCQPCVVTTCGCCGGTAAPAAPAQPAAPQATPPAKMPEPAPKK
jgi:hypothetical protein